MVKRHLKRAAAIFGAVLFGGSILAGCTGQQDPPEQSETQHTHTYSSDWSQDAYYHWRASTCGHADEVGDMGVKLLNVWHMELLFHQSGTPRTMAMSWTALRTMCSPTALQMEPPLS